MSDDQKLVAGAASLAAFAILHTISVVKINRKIRKLDATVNRLEINYDALFTQNA